MDYTIRELRGATGLTQKAFAEMYGIPVSTLRKWEQGESSPAPYVINLLARTLPGTEPSLEQVKDRDGNIYYYNTKLGYVSDSRGNKIFVQEDMEGVKESNLALYLHDLFNSFYEIQGRFNRDCKYDKEEDILWT